MSLFSTSEFWAALVGGLFALLGSWFAHWLQNREKRKEDEAQLNGFLQSVHAELDTLWTLYNEKVGCQLASLESGKPLALVWPVTHDYFSVYSSNGLLLGRVADANLRKSIVIVYTRAKGLIDSYRLNNDMVVRLQNMELLYRQTKDAEYQRQAVALHNTLAQYAVSMKMSHKTLQVEIELLFKRLENSGVILNSNK